MNKLFNLSKFLISISVPLLMLSACKEDEVDIDAPSYHITQSESLTIPTEIAATGTRVATYYAKGVQIYKAELKPGTTNEYQWVFVAPSADLYDNSNQKVGSHFSGPTWQLEAQSVINAQVSVSKSQNSESIDWLLLVPKTGTTPSGTFSGVRYIQRIATTEGKTPSNPPTNASETKGVTYTAIYRFIKD